MFSFLTRNTINNGNIVTKRVMPMDRKPDLSTLDKDELIRLMNLPNHLRQTMLTVIALGEATATDVSKQTGKSRASESDYMNQLERMGYLKRRYSSRKVYFSSV